LNPGSLGISLVAQPLSHSCSLYTICKFQINPKDTGTVRATTGCRPLSHLVTDRRLRLFGHTAHTHHKRTTTVLSGDPGAASRLEATIRKTQPHLALCSEGRPWPTEHWPCICLEEGRQLFVTTGGALWTQQCSSGVCYKRRRRRHRHKDHFGTPYTV